MIVISNLTFDWKKVGENADADKLEVNVCGHVGEVYRAFDNKLWTVRVDMDGKRPFESEAAAKQFVEEKIQDKLVERFKKATADLALFSELGIEFMHELSGEPAHLQPLRFLSEGPGVLFKASGDGLQK